ncbi:hypothetical protein H7U22_22260 [Pedobacter sp. CCM 8938]|uniref:Lipoprotein n=2 Tax=Pedobacter fastidiosus TaxID=2765361 RepID=A0ABR7KYE5_9SPHI|nr:hypothetical protein [Pedobacter fastidiosus]MBC6113149.1 hypothetical protein [Pedobacter fastidiosus]
MKNLIIIASFLLLNSCKSGKMNQLTIIDTDGNKNIAILKDKDRESFELTQKDLEAINEILKTAVAKYNIEKKTHFKNKPITNLQLESYLINLKIYKRQYVPFKNEQEQKEIWINCFCSLDGHYKWQTEIVFVQDGGKCYFNLKINLDKKTYSMFSVNGQA